MTTDAGLLSPVRAGTPVEAVVDDEAWLRALLAAEAALARAQARLGTVPAEAAEVVTEVARSDVFDVRAIALAARESANPVVAVVGALTRAVAARDAEAAEYVHRGSTSQDVFDTAAMLVCARSLRLVGADLERAERALAALAREHRDTPMVGRTLALHAVPTTFGLKAAGWRLLVMDAADRLRAVRTPVSLGGAAGTLAGYLEYADPRAAPDGRAARPGPVRTGPGTDPGGYADLLVAEYARETGLDTPLLPWHALRTPVTDLASALSFTAVALGKIAADVQVLTRTEIGEVGEPAVAGRGGSSAMPHKRNPVLATLMRAAALQVPALASTLHLCATAEDERSAGAWHAEWEPLRACLRLVGGSAHTAAELTEGLVVRAERMRANLDLTGGAVVTERIAAALTPRLGRDAARESVGRLAARSAAEDVPLAELLAEETVGVLSPGQVADMLDPTAYTGAAGHLVDRALSDRRP
ncbi:lyase family protein [Nocardiopsis lambiniae]|uniref:Lyase family protein n=1 Tax=Nocardiopsis lambiniae TaxID=3075539 RepID=A0ABU2M6N7_9ACTN|nr:lyase family protein [Nocardiopsis sp. DSM 44743]MDT0328321.1 lyase family protein [Nocardiopsis sp. DSM 44743]